MIDKVIRINKQDKINVQDKLKSLYRFFLSFSLKVLSFMNLESKTQRKFLHLRMLFYQKKLGI